MTPTVVLLSPDSTERGRWAAALSGAAAVRQARDLAGLAAELLAQPADVLVAPCDSRLLEGIQRCRGDARLILCGPTLPAGVLDAAGQGYDLRHVLRVEELRREVHALARPRSLTVRHELPGLLLRWSGAERDYPVVEISNGGLSFRLELDDELERLLPGAMLPLVKVLHGSVPGLDVEAAVVRYIEQVPAAAPGVSGPARSYYRIGCEFLSSPAGSPPGRTTRLTDGAARAGLLRAALRGSGLCLQSAELGGAVVQCSSGRVALEENELLLEAPLQPFSEHEVVRGTFELGGGSYHFLTSVISVQPLVLRLPAAVEGAHRRSSARYRPDKKQPIEVELSSPLLPGAPSRRAVLELSATGLSFAADPEFDLFPPGMKLSRIELRLPELSICCQGEVKNLAPLPGDEHTLRCGVVFEGLDQEARGQLADAVMKHRFPGLADGNEVPFDELWDFFHETRFLYPEKLAALGPLLPEVRRTFSQLHAEPGKLFKSLIYKEGGRVYGHLSSVRAYRRTWLVQHLAGTTRLRGRQAPQIVNLGLAEYFGQNTELEYVKVFFRPDNKWPARVFGGFARKVSDKQLSDLRTFEYLSLSTDRILPATPGLRVITAGPAELAMVERHFVSTERGLLLRSDDLTRNALGLGELSDGFGAIGLARRREVLVALRGDLPVGFALCELSSPGLNLSELLSSFRMHLLPEATAGAETPEQAARLRVQVRQELLRVVLPLYRRARRAFAFGLFNPGEDDPASLLTQARKQYTCWTCHRTLYRRFCEHIDRLYERLDRDRARSPQPTHAISDGELVRGDAA